MFGAQEFILHAGHFLFGGFQGGAQFVADEDLHGALHARPAGDLGLELFLKRGAGDAQLVEQGSGDALGLFQQGEEHLFGIEFRDAEGRRRFLGSGECFLHLGRQFI